MPKVSLDLTGQWQFKQYPLSARRMRDLDLTGWQTAAVPSSVFTSLIAAGRIKQADIDANPEQFSWVSERPWVYRKVFDVPAELLDCDRIDLAFDGLDTIASVWLNDKLIGKTNNMFIPFRFDVTQLLKQRNNSLMVRFEPAIQYAQRLMNRYSRFSESDFTNPYRVYIRKAQYQFGWDFCPSLPGCGIWRPVRLDGTKRARLAGMHIRTVDCNHHYADIKISVSLDVVTEKDFLCRLTLSCGGKTIAHELAFGREENFHSTVIRIENPLLWWPAGYGPQNLYQLDVQLLSGGEVIDRRQGKFGIRTVKLNRKPDERYHRVSQNDRKNFQFEVNGRAIFARGANWVPASIFAGSVVRDDYEKILHAAEESNINMLRVWGGGYYETDDFYELCDRLGIMVWQDFMFTCAYYPGRQWFLKQIKAEAAAVIKRLRNHPCLSLWCGNNEIDRMHHAGRLGRGRKFYGRAIYHKLLPQLTAELDPDTEYIPTTPLTEKGKSGTSQPITTHQWDVWTSHQPIRRYFSQPVPGFVTEFGLQSLPCMETVRSFCSPRQLRIGSLSVEKHNYQLDGNSRLYRYVGDLFGTAENLEQLIYLSQLAQARAAKAYVEHLRAHSGNNNGVLFWQFNDCCPAISFSAVDYAKRPKVLYYYAKRFFSKQLITVVSEPQKVRTYLPDQLQPAGVIAINGNDKPLTAMLNCRLIDLFGKVLDQVAFPIVIAPFSNSAPLKLSKTLISPADPAGCALHLSMDKNGKKISENLFFYLPDKYIDWPDVEISRQISQVSENQWLLKLSSNAIVKDVQIATAVPAQFSDNFIDLIPLGESEITIACEQQIPSLESMLRLCSIKSVF